MARSANIQTNILFKNVRVAKNSLDAASGANVAPRLERAKGALLALVPFLEDTLARYEASAEETRAIMGARGLSESELLNSEMRGIKAVESLLKKIEIADSPFEVGNALFAAERFRENFIR